MAILKQQNKTKQDLKHITDILSFYKDDMAIMFENGIWSKIGLKTLQFPDFRGWQLLSVDSSQLAMPFTLSKVT